MDRNSLVLLDSLRTNADTNAPTFVDIPQDYGDLIMIWSGRHNVDASNDFVNMIVRMNGDGGTNYVRATTAITYESTALTTPELTGVGSATAAGAGMVGPENSGGWCMIHRYTAGQSKDVYGWGTARDGYGQGGAGSGRRFFMCSGLWANTAPVNSLRFWPQGHEWASGMTAYLLGTPRVS